MIIVTIIIIIMVIVIITITTVLIIVMIIVTITIIMMITRWCSKADAKEEVGPGKQAVLCQGRTAHEVCFLLCR